MRWEPDTSAPGTNRGDVSTPLRDAGVVVADVASFFPSHLALGSALDDLVADLERTDGSHVSFDRPEIYLAALDLDHLAMVQHYLGTPPALTGVHIRRDVGGKVGGIKHWHVDSEDGAVLRLIVYLADVDHTNGPFEFVPDSWRETCNHLLRRDVIDDPLDGYRSATVTDEVMSAVVAPTHWQAFTGPRSTCVLVDAARLFHRTRPHDAERLTLTFTYTSRCPRHPEVRRNPDLDHLLVEAQSSCFYAATPRTD